MTKLVIAFHNFGNALNKSQSCRQRFDKYVREYIVEILNSFDSECENNILVIVHIFIPVQNTNTFK